jgi:hypothetical protein
MTRILAIVAVTAILAGCAGSGGSQSTSKEGESKSSMISDVQSARIEASTLSARKLMFTKVKGSAVKGDAAAEYEAFYQGDVLRILEEEIDYGDRGESEKDYFLDSQGRLFYYTASDERVKEGAKDKVKIRIAYDETGNVLGSEKTVNGQPAKLSDTELKAVKARLGTLRKTADAAKVAAK